MQKLLGQLLPAITHEVVAADGKTKRNDEEVSRVPISSLAFDSRDVQNGSLFFALPGTHIHGNEFIIAALEKGANAIVYEGELSSSCKKKCAELIAHRALKNLSSNEITIDTTLPVFIHVADARFSMAGISDAFYDSPSKRLVVIGVTGTEGKSSTVSFIWQLLQNAGVKAGFISTVEYSFGEEAIPNPEHQTTPESPIIQHHLNTMLEHGCTHAVIESSSHGLSQKTNRLGNVLFDCGVFMNVKLEHLEFHKTFEQYRSDKANLFRALDVHSHRKIIAGVPKTIFASGIVNLDDDSAPYFISATKKTIFTFSTNEKNTNATLRTKNISSNKNGISFTLQTQNQIENNANETSIASVLGILGNDKNSFEVSAPLPGSFNAWNLMASLLAVSSVTEKSIAKLLPLLTKLAPIKGRMTHVNEGQNFEVIVDYAHTPSSFETIFPPIKSRCKGKLFALFGSGGERDVVKRPLQGEIASRFCDYVILCDEDPRGEDPMQLLEDIAKGCVNGGMQKNANLFLIPDRPTAIRKAFSMAAENDIVLLLGKSHENTIIYKDHVMPYDEITEAQTALRELEMRS